MRESRNPFRLRAAEQIESEATFLRLFEPAVLEMLPQNALTIPVLLLRSAPGAGKTSLFRLFTPAALQTVRANATREEYRDLYKRLGELGAVDASAVRALGIRLSCAHTYAGLDDVGVGGTADRLLFGLLNARLCLALLRDLAVLGQAGMQEALETISIESAAPPSIALPSPMSGAQLFAWARELEARICGVLDSLETGDEGVGGQETLHVLEFFSTASFTHNGVRLNVRPLVLLDDVHLLTERQRGRLLDELVRLRSSTPVWLAQRYEAMAPVELLSSGAAEGRDLATVYLERYWRDNSRRFETFAHAVADRRALSADNADLSDFGSCLQEAIDPDKWSAKLHAAEATLRVRTKALAGAGQVFAEWLRLRENSTESPYERVVEWRALEILIEREHRRDQVTLDLALTPEELESRDGADVRRAAELFVSQEFGLPKYFGVKAVAILASSNIDQYLTLAGDLFEEALSAALLNRQPSLSPERQDAIVRAVGSARWNELPTRVAGGRQTREFLRAIGTFAKAQTYRPTAPYSPGITGIAYAMADDAMLHKQYPDLAAAIAGAVADNLLEPIPDYRCKGQLWMVLYLNRLLCAHFELPLGYGGFRELKLKDLHEWYLRGPTAPQRRFL